MTPGLLQWAHDVAFVCIVVLVLAIAIMLQPPERKPPGA